MARLQRTNSDLRCEQCSLHLPHGGFNYPPCRRLYQEKPAGQCKLCFLGRPVGHRRWQTTKILRPSAHELLHRRLVRHRRCEGAVNRCAFCPNKIKEIIEESPANGPTHGTAWRTCTFRAHGHRDEPPTAQTGNFRHHSARSSREILQSGFFCCRSKWLKRCSSKAA